MRLWIGVHLGRDYYESDYEKQDEVDLEHILMLTKVAEHANSIYPGTVPVPLQMYAHLRSKDLKDDVRDLWAALNETKNTYKTGIFLAMKLCPKLDFPGQPDVAVFSTFYRMQIRFLLVTWIVPLAI